MEFLTQLEIDNNHPDNFKSLLESTKVLVLKKAPTNDDHSFYKGLAESAGFLTLFEESPENGALKRNWLEIRYIPTEAEKTFKHSNHFQPLHTDYAYFSIVVEISFFYCIEQALFGGSTHFIDSDVVAKILEHVDPALFKEVTETPIKYNRGSDEFSLNEDRILTPNSNGGYSVAWNYFRVMRDDEISAKLADRFKQFVDTHIERSGEIQSVTLQPGDAVFFRDCEVLHGRSSFVGSRHLNKGGIILNDIENKTAVLSSYLKRINA